MFLIDLRIRRTDSANHVENRLSLRRESHHYRHRYVLCTRYGFRLMMVRDISCLWRGAVCTLNQVYFDSAQGRQKAMDRARNHYSNIPYEAGSPCRSARRSSWGILDCGCSFTRCIICPPRSLWNPYSSETRLIL